MDVLHACEVHDDCISREMNGPCKLVFPFDFVDQRSNMGMVSRNIKSDDKSDFEYRKSDDKYNKSDDK